MSTTPVRQEQRTTTTTTKRAGFIVIVFRVVLEVPVPALLLPGIGRDLGTALGARRLVGAHVLQRRPRPVAVRHLRATGQGELRLPGDRGTTIRRLEVVTF